MNSGEQKNNLLTVVALNLVFYGIAASLWNFYVLAGSVLFSLCTWALAEQLRIDTSRPPQPKLTPEQEREAIDKAKQEMTKGCSALIAGCGCVLPVGVFLWVIFHPSPMPPPGQPEPAAYQAPATVEHQLACIHNGTTVAANHPDVAAFARALDSLTRKTTSSRQQAGDIIANSRNHLKSRGRDVSLLAIAQALDEAIPADSPRLDLAELAAAFCVRMAP